MVARMLTRIFVLLISLFLMATTQAQTVVNDVFTASEGSLLAGDAPNNNVPDEVWIGNSWFGVQGNGESRQYTSVLKFNDLNIPGGAQINSATLAMGTHLHSTTDPVTVQIQSLLRPWETGLEANTGNSLADAPEATWNSSAHGVQLWTTPGGVGVGTDVAPNVDSFMVWGPSSTQNFDVTGSLQQQANSGNFYGWLMSTSTSNTVGGLALWSNGVPTDPPVLTVEYEIIPLPPASVFEWQADDVGSWANSDSWSFVGPTNNGIANNPNHTAIFVDQIFTDTTAVTNAAVTVNRIEFNNITHSYNIAGHGSINLAAKTDPAMTNPSMSVEGVHQFTAIVNLMADAQIDVGSDSTLSFNHELNLMGGTLTKTGVGTLNVNNKLTTAGGSLTVQQGTLSGNGTIGGDVNNDGGTISPGSLSGDGANVVPEPGSLMLILLGMTGLLVGLSQRRGRRSNQA